MVLPRLRFFLPCSAILAVAMVTARADAILLGNLPSNDQGAGLVSSGTIRGMTFTTTGSNFKVSSVTLSLVDYDSAEDTAMLTFHLGGTSAPDPTIYASMEAQGPTGDTPDEFLFTPTSAVTLQANTMYWLVIAAASDEDTFSWYRSDPVVDPSTELALYGSQEISENGGASWEPGDDGPHSLQINGTAVPEPTAVILLGLGFSGALVAQKRRRQARGRH